MNPPARVFDLKQWQTLQDLFSEIIGANVTLLDASGAAQNQASRVTGFCGDFARPARGKREFHPPDCVFRSFHHATRAGTGRFGCVHRLHYYNLPLRLSGEAIGAVVLGPLLLGRREHERTYRLMCRKLAVDPSPFLDALRELRVFSLERIQVMGKFLEEVMRHLARLEEQKRRVSELLPGLVPDPSRFFSGLYVGQIADFLLDLCGPFVSADSGSVLLRHTKERCFTLESGRGLDLDAGTKVLIPEGDGVAGWVAARGKPVIINRKVSEPSLKERLRRPQIKNSMVVPLGTDEKLLGLLCLNARSENKKFNRVNLMLMAQLGRLAGAALSRARAV